jgi:N-acetylglucosamine-6-sulfatase
MFRTVTLLFLLFLSARLTGQDPRPNIVMIVVDDMRYDEWGGGGHPYLQTPEIDRLAREGTRFNRAYHAVPLCSPNRASILTGQYPSRHGIIDNTSRNQASFMLDLFPKYLQEAGYTTAHVGKWHMGNSSAPRPGYDYWVCMEGQGTTNDPVLYEGGASYVAKGYITDIFTEKAVGFIRDNAEGPFFLYIGHKAVHPEAVQRDDGTTDLDVPKEFIPAKRHQGLYEGKTYQRSPSYSPTATVEGGKPVIENAFKLRSEALAADPRWAGSMDLGISEKTIQTRAEMMLAVDESLGRIRAELERLGISQNTVVIFTSDNGYFFGEHGFSLERRMPYEESVRAPLIIRHPGIAAPVKEVGGLALSVDLAATALDVAGIPVAATIQGKSLLPLLTGQVADLRTSGLIEYYSNENPFPWTAQLDYRVVVTDRYKYIKWLRFSQAELYDLASDPYELQNLVADPAHQGVVGQLQEQLRHLQLEALGLE